LFAIQDRLEYALPKAGSGDAEADAAAAAASKEKEDADAAAAAEEQGDDDALGGGEGGGGFDLPLHRFSAAIPFNGLCESIRTKMVSSDEVSRRNESSGRRMRVVAV